MCAASSLWGWTISKNDFPGRGPHKNRKAGIYDEKDLQDRSGLRKLRPEDGGRCQHRCRCGKGDCQLHDPEDEGEFAEGADPHATMENVLSACKKVEDDCEIFDI